MENVDEGSKSFIIFVGKFWEAEICCGAVDDVDVGPAYGVCGAGKEYPFFYCFCWHALKSVYTIYIYIYRQINQGIFTEIFSFY